MFRVMFTLAMFIVFNVTAQSAPGTHKKISDNPTRVIIESLPSAQPTEVKIVATPEPRPELPEERQSRLAHEANESRLAKYTLWLAIATIVLVGIATLQAGLFFWQLRYMRRSLTDASNSVGAARHGVSVAKQTMVATNRAYVHHNGLQYISHLLLPQGRVFWTFLPMWTNTGNTPTRDLKVVVKYSLENAPIGDDFDFSVEKPALPASIAAHGGLYSDAFDIFGTDLDDVQNGIKYLYIWGVAWYKDAFPESPEHITKFCVVATRVTGNPLKLWDDKDNRFDIKFVNFRTHCCVDAECGSYNDPRFAMS